ncbi:MAG: uncharacterized protein KVP18_003934 [Porospora cf. gigantea A]|uniref:uncharacterized protein n=1 Tax=Porospora cf. gigantea A TaxID=2853593 RepID=UPI00355999EC|nr:MAG: hypothetical protein KVP18_003934 [Porospora cf. gigantea A]
MVASLKTVTASEIKALGISLIDNTSLNLNDTPHDISALVKKSLAAKPYTAAVCVYPAHVKQCAEELKGTGVTVATVVNFPQGDMARDEVLEQTTYSVLAGADEVDLVVDYKDIIENQDGGLRRAEELVRAVKGACGTAILKVIIESGELKDVDLIKEASRAAISGGADFIKTSTGKVPVNCTPEAARAMLEVIKEMGKSVGFKGAGGIKSYDDTKFYLILAEDIMGEGWVTRNNFRFGASSLLGVLRDGAAASAGY